MSKKYGVAIWWLIFWTFSLLLLSALQIHTSHTSTRTPHTHVWQFLFTSGRMSFRYFFLTIDSCCNNFTLAFISIWLLGQYQSNVSARLTLFNLTTTRSENKRKKKIHFAVYFGWFCFPFSFVRSSIWARVHVVFAMQFTFFCSIYYCYYCCWVFCAIAV